VSYFEKIAIYQVMKKSFIHIGAKLNGTDKESTKVGIPRANQRKTNATTKGVRRRRPPILLDDEYRDDMYHDDDDSEASGSRSVSTASFDDTRTTEDSNLGRIRNTDDDLTYFTMESQTDDDATFFTGGTSITSRASFAINKRSRDPYLTTSPLKSRFGGKIWEDDDMSTGSSSDTTPPAPTFLKRLLFDKHRRPVRNQSISLPGSPAHGELRDDEGCIIERINATAIDQDIKTGDTGDQGGKVERGSKKKSIGLGWLGNAFGVRKDGSPLKVSETMLTEVGQEVELAGTNSFKEPSIIFRPEIASTKTGSIDTSRSGLSSDSGGAETTVSNAKRVNVRTAKPITKTGSIDKSRSESSSDSEGSETTVSNARRVSVRTAKPISSKDDKKVNIKEVTSKKRVNVRTAKPVTKTGSIDKSRSGSSSDIGGTETTVSNAKRVNVRTAKVVSSKDNKKVNIKEVNSKKHKPTSPHARAFLKIPATNLEGTVHTPKYMNFRSFSRRNRHRDNVSTKKLEHGATINYIASRRMKHIGSTKTHAAIVADAPAIVQTTPTHTQHKPLEFRKTHNAVVTDASAIVQTTPTHTHHSDVLRALRESGPFTKFAITQLDTCTEEDSHYSQLSETDITEITESLAVRKELSCDANFVEKRLPGSKYKAPTSSTSAKDVEDDSSAAAGELAVATLCAPKPFQSMPSNTNDKRNMIEKVTDAMEGAENAAYNAAKMFFCAGTGGNSSEDLVENDLDLEKDKHNTIPAGELNGMEKGIAMDIESLPMHETCGVGQSNITVGNKDNIQSGKREGVATSTNSGEKQPHAASPHVTPQRRSLRLSSPSMSVPSSRAFMRKRSRKQDSKVDDYDAILNEDNFMADILNEIKLEQENQNKEAVGSALVVLGEERMAGAAACVPRDMDYLPQNLSDLIAGAIAEEAVLGCMEETRGSA